MNVLESIEEVSEIEQDVVVLMDLEGTLTTAHPPKVKSLGDTQNLEKVFEEHRRKNLGYWGTFQALTGENWGNYEKRFSEWKSGKISKEEFEEKNTALWNKMMDESKFESAEELLKKFNEDFLHLRDSASQFVNELNQKNCRTGILSHAPDRFVKKAAIKLQVDFFVPNISFKIENKKFDWVKDNDLTKNKVNLLKQFEKTEHQVLFIGNGSNDIDIAENADLGYLVENEDSVNYSDVSAFTGDFKQVKTKVKEDIERKT